MTIPDHKWAILLELSPDDWIYVTEDTGGNCWDLTVKTFDDIKEAERFAEDLRKSHKDKRGVKVVEYAK